MKILVIGTVEFTKQMLQVLLNANINICGLISMPTNKLNSDYFDFREFAKSNKIPHLQVYEINSKEVRDWILKSNPDVIFCLGWSRIISTEILNIPTFGTIGYHPSELPMNRGRHPIIWALVLGLEKTGSSFFLMNEHADSGDIISQEIVIINPDDNSNDLYNKLIKVASSQILDICKNLVIGKLELSPQDTSVINYWRRRTKEDGKIDFRMSSKSIFNHVRALAKPYPGSYLIYKGQEVKIWNVNVVPCSNSNIEPGKIIDVSNRIITVKSGDGAVNIIDHEFIDLPFTGDYL
jgi:methionyl-tRNA formyltransferase